MPTVNRRSSEIPLGQAEMSASLPVAVASDQILTSLMHVEDSNSHNFVPVAGVDMDGYHALFVVAANSFPIEGYVGLLDGSTVNAADTTGELRSGSASYPPKYAAISAASSGNNTLVAAVTNKKIRVLALAISSSGTVNAKFQSGAGGADRTGLFYLAAGSQTQITLPYNKQGWFETAAGSLLNLNLSAATAVGGCLIYIEA